MKQEKFKIIQFIRELILHVDNQLDYIKVLYLWIFTYKT